MDGPARQEPLWHGPCSGIEPGPLHIGIKINWVSADINPPARAVLNADVLAVDGPFQKFQARIDGQCCHEGAVSRCVYVLHALGFLVPVSPFSLDDTERVNPKILQAELPSYLNSIPQGRPDIDHKYLVYFRGREYPSSLRNMTALCSGQFPPAIGSSNIFSVVKCPIRNEPEDAWSILTTDVENFVGNLPLPRWQL